MRHEARWARQEAPVRTGRRLDAQTLAAFGAPGVEDFSPTLGRHAGTEAMSALALQIARLKCSLHSRASDVRVLKGAAILGRGHDAVNFPAAGRSGLSGVIYRLAESRKTSNRKGKFLRLVGCCLLGAPPLVDKGIIGSRLNDLGRANVCVKPHEQTRAILWVAVGTFAAPKSSKFYPQVLNRFPHILVGGKFTKLKLFGNDKFLNFPGIKKSLVISHALRSHLIMFVCRIPTSQGQPKHSATQTKAKPSEEGNLAGITR